MPLRSAFDKQGGHAQKTLSRVRLPKPIGTGTCGIAIQSQRAHKLAKRAKSARAVKDNMRGHTWLEAGDST